MGLEVIGSARVRFEDNAASPCEKTISDEDSEAFKQEEISLQAQERDRFFSRGVYPVQILRNQ